MLHANIKIENIDYEQTISAVFPMLKDYIVKSESGNPVILLLTKLDDKALPVFLKLLRFLPDNTKDELMTVCLNTYSEKACEKLNEKLSENVMGQHIQIGSVSIRKCEEAFYLQLGNIKCNYSALVRESVSGVGGAGLALLAGLGGQLLEKKAIDLLWTTENKAKVLTMVRNTVSQYGLVMELSDIDLTKEIAQVGDTVPSQDNKLRLSDELQNEILNALVKYLQSTVE